MIKNTWYVVEQSNNIGKAPKRVRIIGQDLAVFRDAQGVAKVISDICVHRGGSLAGGVVVDGDIECPYHGWRFNGEGRCTKIPAQPGARIPTRARVDAYPTIERYGWIWAFMGDLPEAERPPLPDLSWVDAPGVRTIQGHFDWKANWERVMENGLDFAHAPFVHGTAFGDRNAPEMGDFEVEMGEWGADAKMVLQVPTRSAGGLGGRKGTTRRTPTNANPGFNFAGPVVILFLRPRGDWQINLVSAHVPVDEDNTRSWWIMTRNFMTSPFFDKMTHKRNTNIFVQDHEVLSNVRPERVPDNWREEVTVKSDALQVAFRHKLRQLEKKGWKIDTDRVRSEFLGKRACVVGGPERREVSDWVFEDAPYVPGPQT